MTYVWHGEREVLNLLTAGRVSSLMALVAIFLLINLGIKLARTRLPKIRPIAALEAVEEAVGRATEMGKSIFTTPGWADVSGDSAAATFAALEIISHVAGLTARYGTKLVVAVSFPNVYPLAQQAVQEAYLAAGKAHMFDQDMIRFTSPMQYAYAAACLGMIQRENVAAAVLVGHFASEAVNFVEATVAAGAMAIAGTTNTSQLPYFAAACDYTMIGEELLAAGAYLSNDPARVGSIAGQDYAKLVILALLVVGVILRTMNIKIVSDLLKL